MQSKVNLPLAAHDRSLEQLCVWGGLLRLLKACGFLRFSVSLSAFFAFVVLPRVWQHESFRRKLSTLLVYKCSESTGKQVLVPARPTPAAVQRRGFTQSCTLYPNPVPCHAAVTCTKEASN